MVYGSFHSKWWIKDNMFLNLKLDVCVKRLENVMFHSIFACLIKMDTAQHAQCGWEQVHWSSSECQTCTATASPPCSWSLHCMNRSPITFQAPRASYKSSSEHCPHYFPKRQAFVLPYFDLILSPFLDSRVINVPFWIFWPFAVFCYWKTLFTPFLVNKMLKVPQHVPGAWGFMLQSVGQTHTYCCLACLNTIYP